METFNYKIRLGVGKYNYLDKAYRDLIRKQINDSESWTKRWETYDMIINEIIQQGNDEIFEEIKYRVTDGENINQVLLSIMKDEMSYNLTTSMLIYKIKEYSDIDWLKEFCR
jgi:hypothetical protein